MISLSVLKIFQTADLPNIDIQGVSSSASSVPAHVPLDIIDSVINETDDTDNFADFEIFNDDVFNLDERQDDALLEDVTAYENELFSNKSSSVSGWGASEQER